MRKNVILPLPPVILNEVKNLCSWLTFCYDAILHFVQNDKQSSPFIPLLFPSYSPPLEGAGGGRGGGQGDVSFVCQRETPIKASNRIK